VACGANKYATGGASVCIAQPTCGAGFKMSADTKTALRTCSACGANTYKVGDNRATSCTAQPTCGAGFKMSGSYSNQIRSKQCSVSSSLIQYAGDNRNNPVFGGGGFVGSLTLAECKARCDTDTDSYGRKCVAIEFSDGGSPTLSASTKRSCALLWGCESTSLYWSGGSVYKRDATTTTTTTTDSFDTKTALRTCSACGANTYKVGDNRATSCTAQPTCGAGFKMSADTKTALRTCSACGANTYEVGDNRVTSCTEQPTCGAGFKMSADTKTALRTCSACGANTYKVGDNRATSCTTQPTCVAGQFISKNLKTERRTCTTSLAKAKLLREAAAPGLQQARKVRLGATTTVAPLSKENWNCALDGCSPGSWCADDQQCKHHTTCHVEQTQVRAGDQSSDTVCRWNAYSGVPCLHIACQHTNEKLINVVHRKNEAPRFKFHHCNHRDEGPTCKCRCHLGSREAEHANNTPAPLDGGWSLFSEFGRCHSECTVETGPAGWKSKYRACNSPKPANGGAFCKGADWETVPCTDSACDKPMPVVEGS